MKNLLLIAIMLCSTHLFAQDIIFEDDFEAGTTFKAEWEEKPNLTGADGVVEIDDLIGADESQFAAKIGKSLDGGVATNALDLHLDLSGQDQVELSFKILDFNDATDFEDGLYFSDDGGESFTKVYDFRAEDWADYIYGQFPPFDVDKLAEIYGLELTDKFVIRFQQYGDSDFNISNGNDGDGFYIDDVVVRVPPTKYVNEFPFRDGFESGTLGSAWAWSHGDSTALPQENTVKPTGLVEILDGIGAEGSKFALRMGKLADGGGYTTNALDLHLDLSGQDQVELSFKILDFNDATDFEDGLYFSDDGGESFTKVYDFRAEDWADYIYGQFPPFDVDKLAEIYGLELTDKFVIRFQQYGDSDFNISNGNDGDGFYIDDVVVRVPSIEYVKPGFEEDFESGQLDNKWAWSHGDSTALPQENTVKPTGLVEILDGIGAEGSKFALRMGKLADGGGYTTNALDLHLDLSGQSQTEMSFKILDFNDATDFEDGLYFSDDGGESFTKVYDFRAEDWADYIYSEVSINILQLAFDNGLVLTDKFIIRFQQYGDSDFNISNGNDGDGLYIDDISVKNSKLPFITSFSPGIGPVDREVTISGVNFGDASEVQFNGVKANDFNVIDAATIIAKVPTGAETGKINVTNTGGTVSSENEFIVSSEAISAPFNLKAQALQGNIKLLWEDTAKNETGFFVERKEDSEGSVFMQIAILSLNVTTFGDANVEKDKIYKYRVRSFNTLGNSDYSNEAQAKAIEGPIIIPTSPTAPTAPKASALSQNEIMLEWTDNSDDETGFSIKRSTDGTTFAQLLIVPADQTTYKDVGLTSGTQYFYQISADNNGVASDAIEANATTKSSPTAPATPEGLTATASEETEAKITLTWTDVAEEDGYKIYRSDAADGAFSLVTEVAADVTTFSDQGILFDKTYFYKVEAFNSGGNSEPSQEASASTPLGPLGFEDEVLSGALKLYPNPAESTLHLSLEDAEVNGTLQIRLLNQLGQEKLATEVVKSASLAAFTLDTSHLPQGVYFLEITQEDYRVTRRVVKQ